MEAVLSMFPSGSITGCPKRSAMQIIDTWEPVRRSFYTGSLGMMTPNGEMDWNVAIRTILKKGSSLFLSVGGGITIESDMESEYQESLKKAQSFFHWSRP